MARPERARLLVLPTTERAEFLLLSLPKAELRRACGKLGLSFPGYRLEKVPPIELAQALAEEYEAQPHAASLLDGRLDEVCGAPFPVSADPIRAGMVNLLTIVAAAPPERAVTPLLWQFFSHPVEKVREAGAHAFDGYARFLDAIVMDLASDASSDDRALHPASGGLPGDSRARLRERLREIEARAAAMERDLVNLKHKLAEERQQVALRDERLVRVKENLAATERRLRASEEVRSGLEAARDKDAAAEARLRQAEAERLAREVGTLQADLAAARRREAELLSRLKAAETSPAIAAPSARTESPPDAGSGFQVPVFSSEFYDSIRRWDPRIVRAAFEKVLLLAQNLSHPGLDAKPIQGADGLYRIYVAQDVRLFYRRLLAGRLEILSLVDRENLDRYIRQYRTRADA